MELVEKNIEDFCKTNIVKNNTLVQYNDKDFVICLPPQITSIDKEAFNFKNYLQAIFIPDTVKMIADGYILEAEKEGERDDFIGAFSKCYNLRQVRLSKSLQKIADCCFANCFSIENIVVPEKVTQIGKMAFYGCNELKKINIPSSCNSIMMYAFYNCYSLKYIFIPKSVSYIGKYAFSGMTDEQTIVFECDKAESENFHVGWYSGCEAKVVWNYKNKSAN